jgi:outer membrane lipoprotein-sorting protein
MKRMRRCAVFLLALCITSCAGVPADHVTNGYELIEAMNQIYRDKWYDNLCIQQKVTFYQDGKAGRQEVWNEFLALPGQVRSNVGNPEDGNCEIYRDGAFHVFQDGKLVRKGETVHNVLLLGFDVYVQDPGQTTDQLQAAGFDLDQLYETDWQGRPATVVGAQPGDQESNQFWIDKERLLVVRLLTRSAQGNLIEVEFNEYEPLGDGWIAMELVFKRNGQLIVFEEYLNVRVLDSLEPDIFDVEDLKTHLTMPECN